MTSPEKTSAAKNIEELIDENEVLEAQRDHYRNRCNELTTELNHYRQRLNNRLQTSEYNIDPYIFDNESLERLQEWQTCLKCCIEEKMERMKLEGKTSPEVNGERSTGAELKGQKRFETELPFSPSNLTGFLTKNHKLTQGHTKYPEPRPKGPGA